MTGPNVYFYLGAPPGTDYGGCVQQLDIWQESLNGVGTWEIIADPNAGCSWPAINAINTDTQVHIQIDDWAVPPVPQTMMRGYVDDVLPYLDPKGYHTKLYKITGRNRGMDLAQHYVTAEYNTMRADLVVAALLGIIAAPAVPTELTLNLVGAAPVGTIDYEADRTYLSDAVRDIANLAGFDFFVDNGTWAAGNAILNFFAPGASASPVVLRSQAGFATNNILKIDPYGEEIGFNVKNHVDAYAGGLADHWTDMNGAADWTGINCNVTDDSTAGLIPGTGSPYFLNGKASIRATNNTGGNAVLTIDLTFPRYDYDATWGRLDMSKPSRASYNYLMQDDVTGIKKLRLRLLDNLNNEIEFYRANWVGLLKCFNCTDQPTNLEWRKVDFPVGYEAGIEAAIRAGDAKGHWYYFANPAPPFNWQDIRRVRFTTTALATPDLDDYFLLDGLQIPSVEVRSIQTSAVTYGTRMTHISRPDIKNQVDLDAFAVSQLDRIEDPKETMRLTAIGQTGTPYAAQTLSVNAPAFDPAGITIYRILRLHHRVVKNVTESDVPSHTYTTEYDLVRYAYHLGGTQRVDQTRVISTTSPTESRIRKYRLNDRYRKVPWSVGVYP